jgi:hypothetical protein
MESADFLEYIDNDTVLFRLNTLQYYVENQIDCISIRAVLELWKVFHFTCDYVMMYYDTSIIHEDRHYGNDSMQDKILWILTDIARECIRRGQNQLDRWSVIVDVISGPSYAEIYFPIVPVLDVMNWYRELELERTEEVNIYFQHWWNAFFHY